MPFGIVPGKRRPLMLDTFLQLLIEEFNRVSLDLQTSVRSWDSYNEHKFDLRCHLVMVTGDTPAISTVMGTKGHNAISPCRFCHIIEVPFRPNQKTTYYYPLEPPKGHVHPADSNTPPLIGLPPDTLYMRTNARHRIDARRAELNAAFAKARGLNRLPILAKLDTIDFPCSFPIDMTHLIYQGSVPIMADHWEGKFFSHMREDRWFDYAQFGKDLGDAAC
ncbi:hypothetical protein SAICODRAFT_225264 [Saitoella complicata NRRL Y-17804]|nr:uncharacterized protein SAICODRAFT_225264 [Saitoella complicata NRRL Y-17804]ODQ56611.1 hypothetical protein SAICODRAFT_225264 [Saitoella complicata NRRL Y-17804]